MVSATDHEQLVAGAEPPSLAVKLKALRLERGLSLEALAARSGVSRSMLSQIERDATNPTVATLWRITQALGLSINELLGGQAEPEAHTPEVLAAHALPVIGSADGLMKLKVLGPLATAGKHEWYELRAQPGARLESKPHARGTQEHLFVAEGELTVDCGGARSTVKAGELARYPADVPHTLLCSGGGAAVAWLTVMS